MANRTHRGHRGVLVAIALVCVAGLVVSAELTRIHVLTHVDPTFHSVCAVSEGVNCETVALSPWSVFAGLPVSVWGLLGYAAMGLVSLWGATRWRLHPTWSVGGLTVLCSASVGVSVVLATISATRIDSLCLFCMSLYALNGVLAVLCAVALRRSGASPVQAVWRDLEVLGRRPVLSGAMALAGVAILVVTKAAIPAYWSGPGWDDLAELPTGEVDGHHWYGATDPELVVVEFSDYQCPHCRRAHHHARQLVGEHPERVRLVHRHLPLDKACHPRLRQLDRDFHPRACEFAQAAECASEQGRFWEMNDALFSIQDTTSVAAVDVLALAVQLGLDRSRFQSCLAQPLAPVIEADLTEALALHLRGTPSFVVGDQIHLGALSEQALVQALDASADGGE